MLRALLTALFCFSLVTISGVAEAKRVHGARIPDEVRPDDGRYRVMRNWDKTTRFFRQTYRRVSGVLIQRVPAPPRIKVVHIQNTRARRSWDSINLYQVKGKVYVNVLPHIEPPKDVQP